MKWKSRIRRAFSLCALLLFTSCGGGSGSSGNAPTSPPTAQADPIDQAIRGQWDGITKSLLNNDKQTAMSYLTEDAQQKYGPVFDVLMPEFPQIISTWSAPMSANISGGMAEYAIVTDDGNKRQLFYLYFKLGDDGIWRLESM